VKETLGAENVSIVCGGETVRPGDVIIADEDGVVVVPRLEAESAALAGEARLAKEDAMRVRLAAGGLSLDLANIRPRLEQLGFTYVDSLDELC